MPKKGIHFQKVRRIYVNFSSTHDGVLWHFFDDKEFILERLLMHFPIFKWNLKGRKIKKKIFHFFQEQSTSNIKGLFYDAAN